MTEQVAGPQVEAAVTPVPTPALAPPVLTSEQRALLRAALNRIIPSNERMPSAGDIDVGATIERTLSTTPRLRRLFLDGIAELAITGFLELEPAGQTAVLRRFERDEPAFFSALLEHTYRGYYTHPTILEKLRYGPPPQPLGRTLPAFDPELLAKQRARAPFWRRA
jgi:hypothetical protein